MWTSRPRRVSEWSWWTSEYMVFSRLGNSFRLLHIDIAMLSLSSIRLPSFYLRHGKKVQVHGWQIFINQDQPFLLHLSNLIIIQSIRANVEHLSEDRISMIDRNQRNRNERAPSRNIENRWCSALLMTRDRMKCIICHVHLVRNIETLIESSADHAVCNVIGIYSISALSWDGSWIKLFSTDNLIFLSNDENMIRRS